MWVVAVWVAVVAIWTSRMCVIALVITLSSIARRRVFLRMAAVHVTFVITVVNGTWWRSHLTLDTGIRRIARQTTILRADR